MSNLKLIDKAEVENKLNKLNFPPSDIKETLVNNDVTIVPFPFGELNKTHIDIELAV